MIAALKKAKEEKAEKARLAAELDAAGLGDPSPNKEDGTKTNTLKNLVTGPLSIEAKPTQKPFKCIIRPDNQFKGLWDIVITL